MDANLSTSPLLGYSHICIQEKSRFLLTTLKFVPLSALQNHSFPMRWQTNLCILDSKQFMLHVSSFFHNEVDIWVAILLPFPFAIRLTANNICNLCNAHPPHSVGSSFP
jgi:hypothetical protein